MTQEKFKGWLRLDAATLLLLAGQIVLSIIWLANLGGRVGVIETRGSIQAERCLTDLGTMKEKLDNLGKELEKHERQQK